MCYNLFEKGFVMIKNLSIKNVALISSAQIDFEKGLNVLTGETGAGKSILIDSIGLLLGNKLDKTLLRSGENECKVVGCFEVPNNIKRSVDNFCEKYDLEICDEFIVSRYFNIDGKSQIKINGQTSTLAMLKELSALLVDSYGQHESYMIFDTKNHLKILDDFCQMDKQAHFAEYKNCYQELKNINKQIAQIGGSEEDRTRNIELLAYQIEEIKNANISQEEYDNLVLEKKRLLNIGKIATSTAEASEMLHQNSVQAVARAKNCIMQASMYDEGLASIVDRLESVKIELTDILQTVDEYNDNLNFSDIEQQKIDDRFNLYSLFFRKYGKTVEDILLLLDKMIAEKNMLENAKETLQRLENQKSIVLCKMFDLAKKIRKTRQNGAEQLSNQILDNLHKLNMKNATLSFDFNDYVCEEENLFANGMDMVQIMFSANLGEPQKPISKIASGGEISRFMLALKAVIAKFDNMPTMIFDEIDTGISGATSEAVAKQMATIGKNHQVIVITHSQQIAAMGDANFLIKKQEEDGKTYTLVQRLSEQQKIQEVARFMSGSNITEAALQNAKELVDEQNLFKQNL